MAVHIDTSGLTRLSDQLRTLVVKVTPAMNRSVIEVAETVATKARAITTSEKTRPTIQVVPLPIKGPTVAAEVVAGGGDSPLPALLERGDPKKGGTRWRHPTFGRDPWVDQKVQPYLAPAAAEVAADEGAIVQPFIDEALEEQFGGDI